MLWVDLVIIICNGQKFRFSFCIIKIVISCSYSYIYAKKNLKYDLLLYRKKNGKCLTASKQASKGDPLELKKSPSCKWFLPGLCDSKRCKLRMARWDQMSTFGGKKRNEAFTLRFHFQALDHPYPRSSGYMSKTPAKLFFPNIKTKTTFTYSYSTSLSSFPWRT